MPNNFLSVKWKINDRPLRFLERIFPSRVENYTKEMAQDTVDYARDQWSPTSPSAPGSPPAMVSGDLDTSLGVVKTGGILGKAGHAAVVRAKHGKFLEEGTDRMRPRPFLLPAAMHVFNANSKEKAKAVFSIR